LKGGVFNYSPIFSLVPGHCVNFGGLVIVTDHLWHCTHSTNLLSAIRRMCEFVVINCYGTLYSFYFFIVICLVFVFIMVVACVRFSICFWWFYCDSSNLTYLETGNGTISKFHYCNCGDELQSMLVHCRSDLHWPKPIWQTQLKKYHF